MYTIKFEDGSYIGKTAAYWVKVINLDTCYAFRTKDEASHELEYNKKYNYLKNIPSKIRYHENMGWDTILMFREVEFFKSLNDAIVIKLKLSEV